MGMMPPAGFNVGMDKASASQQVPMNAANMNSSENKLRVTSDELKILFIEFFF
jgi:hypothetical protein